MIAIECKTCSKVFYVTPCRKTAKFCSVECAHLKIKTKKKDVVCEFCQKIFTTAIYNKKARFCSRSCTGKWTARNKPMPLGHLIGNKFRVGKRPTNAFTSEQARIINTVKGNIFRCKNCGTEFELKPNVERRRTLNNISGNLFCTKKCHGEYMKAEMSKEKSPLWVGGKTTYRGKSWTNARTMAVERDNATCVDCKKFIGKSIPVHHIKPFRNFLHEEDANDLSNLVCLCQSCHMKREGKNPA